MSQGTWTTMSDEDLDDLVRAEMAVLRDTVPAPRLDTARLTTSRGPRLRRAPLRPSRLGPAALAVGLAVLLALGSGTWYAMQRLHARQALPAATPPAVPSATPQPTPETTPQPTPNGTPTAPGALTSTVPTGVDVFYVARIAQPADAAHFDALDWNGAAHGGIDIPGWGGGGRPLSVAQSPDGQRLLVGDSVYTAQGRKLYTLPMKTSALWADDSRTLCNLNANLDAQGLAHWSVELLGSDGSVRKRVPLPGALGGDAGYGLESCSLSADRVVAYQGVDASTVAVRVVRISTGRVLLDQDLCGNSNCDPPMADYAVSGDSRIAAESDDKGVVRIRDLRTGRLRALAPRGDIRALSWDGSLLLLGPGGFSATDGGPVMLVRTSDGAVLWSHAGVVVEQTDAGAQPDGAGFAFAWHVPGAPMTPDANGIETQPPAPPSTLLLVRGSAGTPRITTLAEGVVELAFHSY